MAGTLSQLWAAGRLRLLASGEVDLADAATLAKAVELLAGFTPEERYAIGAKAIELGADGAVVTALISLATGEVIEVVGTAPRKGLWWPWLLAGALVVASSGGLAYRARRRRLKSRTPM